MAELATKLAQRKARFGFVHLNCVLIDAVVRVELNAMHKPVVTTHGLVDEVAVDGGTLFAAQRVPPVHERVCSIVDCFDCGLDTVFLHLDQRTNRTTTLSFRHWTFALAHETSENTLATSVHGLSTKTADEVMRWHRRDNVRRVSTKLVKRRNKRTNERK